MAEQRHNDPMSARMLVVSGGVLISRVLGLLRDCTLAAVWGTSPGLAAFLTAWTFPNLLRSLFGEGAFSAAFVPAFSSALERKGREEARRMAAATLSVVATVLLALVLVAIVVSLGVRPVLGPGLLSRAAGIIPWLMPYAIFICLSAALTGVLNSFHRFALPAFSQLLLNLALIGAALAAGWVSARTAGPPPLAFLVAAVLAAGVTQALLLYTVACRNAGKLGFHPRFRDPGVRHVFRLMGPAALGAGVLQVNVLVDRLLACLLGGLAVNTLYYSQRLVYLPVGLFAVAAATVSLPTMSRAWARGEHDEMLASLRLALRQAVFFSLPVFTTLVILHEALVKLFFMRASFTMADAVATAWTMRFYLPGIPAFVLAKIAVAPFHASQDTRTPVRIASLCLLVNVILNLILMQFLEQGGLALATSISSWLNVVLLFTTLRRRLGKLGLGKDVVATARLLLASLCCGAVCAITALTVQTVSGSGFLSRLLMVAIPTAAGGLSYLAFCRLMKCPELSDTLAPVVSKAVALVHKHRART